MSENRNLDLFFANLKIELGGEADRRGGKK